MITPNDVPTNRLYEHMTVIERCETIGNNPDTLLYAITMVDTQKPSTVKLPSQTIIGDQPRFRAKSEQTVVEPRCQCLWRQNLDFNQQVLPIQTNFLLNTMVAKP